MYAHSKKIWMEVKHVEFRAFPQHKSNMGNNPQEISGFLQATLILHSQETKLLVPPPQPHTGLPTFAQPIGTPL